MGEWGLEARIHHLQHTYHFRCQCCACGSGSLPLGTVGDHVRAALRCPVCLDGACSAPPAQLRSLVSLPNAHDCDGLSCSGSSACSSCGSTLAPDYVACCARDLESAAAVCDSAARLLEGLEDTSAASHRKSVLNQAMQLLSQGTQTYEKVLHPGNQLLGRVHHMRGKVAVSLAECESGDACQGCLRQAADAFLRSHSVLARLYPRGSPQLAFELALHEAASLCAAQAGCKSSHSSQAEAMLELHFGQSGVLAARSYVASVFGGRQL